MTGRKKPPTPPAETASSPVVQFSLRNRSAAQQEAITRRTMAKMEAKLDTNRVRELEAKARLEDAELKRSSAKVGAQILEKLAPDEKLDGAWIMTNRLKLYLGALTMGDLGVARGVLADIEKLLPPEQAAPPPNVSIEEQRALVIRSAKALGITGEDLDG